MRRQHCHYTAKKKNNKQTKVRKICVILELNSFTEIAYPKGGAIWTLKNTLNTLILLLKYP